MHCILFIRFVCFATHPPWRPSRAGMQSCCCPLLGFVRRLENVTAGRDRNSRAKTALPTLFCRTNCKKQQCASKCTSPAPKQWGTRDSCGWLTAYDSRSSRVQIKSYSMQSCHPPCNTLRHDPLRWKSVQPKNT